MPTKVKFEVTCPNNHNQTVAFTRDEFEAMLSAASLQFHCNTCDTDWQPTGKDIEHFRSGFEKMERGN